LKKWDDHPVFHLLPGKMTEGPDRFSLFDFSAKPAPLWEAFKKINAFYYDHRYGFSIAAEDGSLVYREFFDGGLLTSFALTGLEYRILQKTQAGPIDLDGLMDALGNEKESETDAASVCAALNHLRKKHLVYFDSDHRSIISVVDVGSPDGFPSA
jgi:hypothetical protein